MKLLNVTYYYLWIFFLTIGKILDKVTDYILMPFKWLSLKIPFVKKRLIKLHGSVEKAGEVMKSSTDFLWNNKEFGFAIMFARCIYGGIIAFYIWGLYFVLAHYFPALLDFFDQNKIPCALGFVGLAAIFTYPASYHKDRYKKYFRELDKVKGLKRFTYKTMTFVFVLGSFAFWLWAMVFAHH